MAALAASSTEVEVDGVVSKGFFALWNRNLNINSDVAEMLNQAADDDEYKAMVFGRDENGRQVYALTYGQYGEDEFAVMTDADGRYITFTFESLMEGM